MDFEQLIAERFSVRSFKQVHLPQENIYKILDAGLKAPTGCNYQPQRILVLNTDESINALKSCTKCHFNRMTYGAPVVLMVCYDKNESWVRKYDGALSAPVDAVIVSTHMMLEAQNLGVGCCWVMHFDPFALRSTFNIPDNVEPTSLLVMGYLSEDAKPLDLHFKSKEISEIVHYESF